MIWAPSVRPSVRDLSIFFRYFTHAFITILRILSSFVRIKLQMADYSQFLFSQIHKIFENLSVQMNISNTNEHFFPILYTCINFSQSSNESCEVSSRSNSKWPTYRHFCLLKLIKYLKILSVRINISNANEYLFPILYTCINYNHPMNPVKFGQDQIQNGWQITIFVAQIDKIFENFVRLLQKCFQNFGCWKCLAKVFVGACIGEMSFLDGLHLNFITFFISSNNTLPSKNVEMCRIHNSQFNHLLGFGLWNNFLSQFVYLRSALGRVDQPAEPLVKRKPLTMYCLSLLIERYV